MSGVFSWEHGAIWFNEKASGQESEDLRGTALSDMQPYQLAAALSLPSIPTAIITNTDISIICRIAANIF